MCKKALAVTMAIFLAWSLAACGNVTPAPRAVETLPAQAPAGAVAATAVPVAAVAVTGSYPVVDTGQSACYNAAGTQTPCPAQGEADYGQDAQYAGHVPSYTDNGDGTVTDNVTGLMWSKSPDLNDDGTINSADKLSYAAASAKADSFTLAGYDDWRLPTIKELYSLIDFRGLDPSGYQGDSSGLVSFIDTDYFEFGFGDTAAGERIIDAQFASATLYGSTTMGGNKTMFGVNLADGRIKGYPSEREKTFYVFFVRGNPNYGVNEFADNGNGTITDHATGLTWDQDDSGAAMNWEEALTWVEQQNAAGYKGYSDWRLPNVKELQSLVDYNRAPDTTNSAAIDPLFRVTAIKNEAGQADYGCYWSSTTHASLQNGANGAYVAFGRALGYMNGAWMDVHGAGAQRSDPKVGNAADYPTGHGPQGDAIRIDNYVRLVRGGVSEQIFVGGTVSSTPGTGAPQSGMPSAGGEPGQNGQQPPQGPGQNGGMPGGNQNPQQPGNGGPQGGTPPQEAITACASLSAGAVCTIQTPQGQVSGTCVQMQQQLACRPAGGRP